MIHNGIIGLVEQASGLSQPASGRMVSAPARCDTVNAVEPKNNMLWLGGIGRDARCDRPEACSTWHKLHHSRFGPVMAGSGPKKSRLFFLIST